MNENYLNDGSVLDQKHDFILSHYEWRGNIEYEIYRCQECPCTCSWTSGRKKDENGNIYLDGEQ